LYKLLFCKSPLYIVDISYRWIQCDVMCFDVSRYFT